MSALPNLGIDLGFTHDAIRRMVFCLTTNDSGTANVISLSNAAAIANWKTQFNQYTHLADHSDRFIPTPLVRQVVKEQVDAIYWEVEDYKRKMRNADADISFALLDPSPYIMKRLAVWEDYTISVFFITEDNKAIGILDGSNLKPIPIKVGSFSVPFYTPGSYDAGSINTVSFRLNAGSDLNELCAVTIADGDVTSDSDFFSLRTTTLTVSSPAVTGCAFTATVDDKDTDAPATTINVTGIVFGEITLVDQAAPYTVKSLAAAESLTYLAGTYTINEASLLTTGHTYSLTISKSGYDCIKADVVVP